MLDRAGAVAAAQAAPFAVVGAERRIHARRHHDGGGPDSRRRCRRLLLLVGVVQLAGVLLEVEIAAESFATNAARKLLKINFLFLLSGPNGKKRQGGELTGFLSLWVCMWKVRL